MKLETLKAEYTGTSPARISKFVGDRPVSKTDKLPLFKFLERVFGHNLICSPESRLEDHEIANLVRQEFAHVETVIKQLDRRNYVSIWRSLFNNAKMNTSMHTAPGFVAYRVTPSKQFTKSTSDRFVLSEEELISDYVHKRGLEVPIKLLEEVRKYANL